MVPIESPNLLISKTSEDSVKSKNLDLRNSELSHKETDAAFQRDQGHGGRLRTAEGWRSREAGRAGYRAKTTKITALSHETVPMSCQELRGQGSQLPELRGCSSSCGMLAV